jgi:hypothetical protein
MRKRLRGALARRWRSWWRRMVGPVHAVKEADEQARRWAEQRSRFWRELREGQREARARLPS